MIVVMSRGASEEQIEEVEQRIRDWGYGVHPIYGTERTVIGAVGVPESEKADYVAQLESLDYVERVIAILRPYKFVSREYHPEGTVVDVRGVPVGGDRITMMAGPCTIESYEQTLETARAVQAAGATILRGGAYKPTTSPYSFPGLGEEGLRILKAVSEETGLRTVTEVMDPRNVELVCDHAHVLQIGTRNMQNYDLLREAGKAQKPVLLKRGMWAKVEEWLQAAEYILLGGNHQVMLCERGIRTYETATRNTLDLSAVPLVKQLSHLPVIVDPSQATGHRSLVVPMTKAAIACGADGILIEVHAHPDRAIKDGAQTVDHATFESLMQSCRTLAAAVGRSI